MNTLKATALAFVFASCVVLFLPVIVAYAYCSSIFICILLLLALLGFDVLYLFLSYTIIRCMVYGAAKMYVVATAILGAIKTTHSIWTCLPTMDTKAIIICLVATLYELYFFWSLSRTAFPTPEVTNDILRHDYLNR